MSNHSTLQLQSNTAIRANTMSNRLASFLAHLLDTKSTPEPTTYGTFTGRRPESPESSTLRFFGSTLRFFTPQNPFRPIASRFGDPTSRVQVGGEVVPLNLAFKLLRVYDALLQTVPSTHYLDVPRHAPSDVFELCAEVLAMDSPGDHLAPTQAKNILSAKRPVKEDLLLLPDETYIFRHISVAATQFDEFKQLVALYARSAPYEAPQTLSRTIRARNIAIAATAFDRFKAKLSPDTRGSLLEASQLLPALSHTIVARIRHSYRIPFTASQLALLLQLHGVVDAVSAGLDYVVTASVYSCTAEYARGFLQGGWQAQVRANPGPSATPTFWGGLSGDVRICTGVTLHDEEVVAAILKEEALMAPGETLGKFDCQLPCQLPPS
jgi:hypothetical protein